MSKDHPKTIRCIKTDWYDSFYCIGGECPYNCCSACWLITVDEETDKKYQALTGEFAERLNEWVDRSQKPAFMQVNGLGRCGMLTPEGWCSVQRELGHEYLSKTCREYPRGQRNEKGVLRIFLELSCPEVARKTLTVSEPLRLIFSEATAEKGAPTTDETAYRTFLTGIRLLQDRDCSIVQRQKLFLTLHQALRDAGGDAKETAEILDFFSTPENYRALAAEPGGCDLVSKLQLLNRLCKPMLQDMPSLQTARLFNEILNAAASGAEVIEHTGSYLSQWNKGACAAALENILVESYLHCFLDANCGDIFQQAIYTVMIAQIFRIFCSVSSASGDGVISLDEQIRNLVLLTRDFEHGSLRKKQIGKTLSEEGLAELGFLFRLIS